MNRKSLFIVSALWLLFQAQTHSQTTFATGFDSPQEKAGWQQFRKGDPPLLSFYEWIYTGIGAYSAPECLMHNYPVAGMVLTDDWYVSPVLSLAGGGVIDSVWHAFTGFGMPGNGDTVALYLLVGSPDPDLASSVLLLQDYRGTDYMNDGIWRKTEGILLPSVTSDAYLAFRYSTVVNWLDVKFDNIGLTLNNPPNHVPEISGKSFCYLYPNPAKERINIKYTGDYDRLTVYDPMGRILLHQDKQTDALDIAGWASGTYIVEIQSASGERYRRKFIKH